MIELRLNNGEMALLAPINKGNDIFELVDDNNKVQMCLKLDTSTFIVQDFGNVDRNQSDLQGKLNILAIQVIEFEQSGIENNEYELIGDITPYNPDLIRVHQKQFSIKFIEEMIDSGDIDFTPDFQRHFVWNSVQKSRLIESLLLRIPLPLFYLAEDDEGRLTIVDGLQRLTTIKQFMNNEFPLRHLEYLGEGVKDRYYKSDNEKGKKGIDSKYYRWFNMTQFAVNVIDPSSPYQVKYDIFRRINTGGRPLRNQEIRNCLSSKSLRALLNSMTSTKEFKMATGGSVKPDRMEDHEVALRFLVFYYAYKKDPTLRTTYNGYMESTLDEATYKFNKISQAEHDSILSKFVNSMKNAEHLFGEKYAFRKILPEHIGLNTRRQLFNKALFVVWSVLLADLPYENIVQQYPKEFMTSKFAQQLKEDTMLMFYLSYGTNGKANLEYIFKTVNDIIKDM